MESGNFSFENCSSEDNRPQNCEAASDDTVFISAGGIVVHPEYERLSGEVKALRENLASLVYERDELELHVCKDIEMEYMLKIGSLEYRVYEAECRVLRLRRKIELIQARLNRQEPVNPQDIEKQLDAEYAEYVEKLQERMRAIDEALQRNRGGWLSAGDTADVKRLYRQLIRRLHPDLNPNATKEEQRLFSMAVSAYKNGDLPALKTISLLLEETNPQATDMGSLDDLRAQRDALSEQCAALTRSIEEIKSSFPCNQKAFLKDARRVEERVGELEELLETYRRTCAEYERKVKIMMEK
ncbi:MAG: hypothetical protein LBR61_03205 [Synergistaceae bacterium]|jgi:hypothetical protein|nr:hypothetical protein [Synergistaceae bacterium]